MKKEDKDLIGTFLLIILTVFLSVISTRYTDQLKNVIVLDLILCIAIFIFYIILIGRPYPRTYSSMISCDGIKDYDNFFWMFYQDFEDILEENPELILKLEAKSKMNYLRLTEKNEIVIDSETEDELKNIQDLIEGIMKIIKIEKYSVSSQKLKSKILCWRSIRQVSTSRVIVIGEAPIKEERCYDLIESATKAFDMTKENLNKNLQKEIIKYTWPEKKGFLKKETLTQKVTRSIKDFIAKAYGYRYPYIWNRELIINKKDHKMIFESIIECKWSIIKIEAENLAEDPINSFIEFIDTLITKDTFLKPQFSNLTFKIVLIQDGSTSDNYVKKIWILEKETELD